MRTVPSATSPRFLTRLSTPVVIAVLAVIGAGCLTAVGLHWARPAGPSWSDYIGVCLAAATATASAAVALRRAAGRVRGVWMAFGCAALAWLAGGVVRAAFEPLLGRPAAPSSLADLFYLLSTVPLVAGFAVMAHRPRRARSWAHLGLDVWICAASAFCLVWVVVLAPLYRSADIGPGFLLLDLAYPIADIVAFCLVIAFLLRTPPSAYRVVRIAFPAVVAITIADTAYAVSLLNSTYNAGGATHLAWVLGYLVLAVAPWVGSLADTDGAEAEDGGARQRMALLVGLVPAVVAALALSTLLAAVFADGVDVRADAVLQWVGISVLVTLLVRLAWSLLDSVDLARRVDTSERRFRSVVHSEGGVVLITALDGTVHYVGGDRERLYGYDVTDIEGQPATEFLHPEDLPRVRYVVGSFLRRGSASESTRIDCRVRAADGTWHHIQSTMSRHADDRLIVIARDVSDQVALREQLDHLTFHDGLTGLPNRAYFEERTREVLIRRDGAGAAVLFLDLDGFTAVNDSIGHVSGDHVLTQAARRLRAAVAPDESEGAVARFGGDEFAVLVDTHRSTQGAVDLAERLLRTLSEPFHVADRDVALTASVGIVFSWAGAETADLLRNADVAMSRARRHGGGRLEVFAASMHADAMRRLELGSLLRQAVDAEQFAIEYQPLVNLGTSQVTGMEALVRWWRDGSLVPPEGFIGYAEESGLIVPIGEWVLREACRQMARWRGADWHVGLSVNLSPRQVIEPRFVETVSEILAETGLSPGALTLEITEDVLVDEVGETIQRLRELRALGVRLAIDDFGTGYASLAYLRQLPVDTLKIDPSFVSGLGTDEVRTLLTRTIVRLGQDLGLLVVAKGIEHPRQLELLREMGCPRGQGYLVARPMAARGAESLLRTGLNTSSVSEYEMSVPTI